MNAKARTNGNHVVALPTPDLSIEQGDLAKQLFDHLLRMGLPGDVAWQRAGLLMSPERGYTDSAHLVTMSQVASGKLRNKSMTTKTKSDKVAKVNGKSQSPSIRLDIPSDDTFAACVGRALVRWCLKMKLALPSAADQLGIERGAIYRIARGNSPQSAGQYIDRLAEAFGCTRTELLEQGEEPIRDNELGD
jgi:hypothetical protein